MADDAKGVRVVGVDLPESLRPGDRATARVEVENNTLLPSPWDEDRCVGEHAGMKIEGVLIGPDGEEYVGDTECVLSAAPLGGKDRKTSEVTFTAPNRDGSHRFEAFARLTESGTETGRRSKRVDVYADPEDAPEEPPEEDDGSTWDRFPGFDGDGDSEDGGSDGPAWPFGGDGPGIAEQIDMIILLVLLFGGMYAAGQLFDINLGGPDA